MKRLGVFVGGCRWLSFLQVLCEVEQSEILSCIAAGAGMWQSWVGARPLVLLQWECDVLTGQSGDCCFIYWKIDQSCSWWSFSNCRFGRKNNHLDPSDESIFYFSLVVGQEIVWNCKIQTTCLQRIARERSDLQNACSTLVLLKSLSHQWLCASARPFSLD